MDVGGGVGGRKSAGSSNIARVGEPGGEEVSDMVGEVRIVLWAVVIKATEWEVMGV